MKAHASIITALAAIFTLVSFSSAAPVTDLIVVANADDINAPKYLDIGTHTLKTSTGNYVNITVSSIDDHPLLAKRQGAAGEKNCAWKQPNPIGTCIDVCRYTNYQECQNNICTPPCTLISVPPDWVSFDSIKFEGSTKCWLIAPGTGSGQFLLAYSSQSDVTAYAGFHCGFAQCWRDN